MPPNIVKQLHCQCCGLAVCGTCTKQKLEMHPNTLVCDKCYAR